MVFFIIWNIIAVVYTIIKFMYFTKRNPTSELQEETKKYYSSKVLFYLLDIWSFMNFWLLVIGTFAVYVNYRVNASAQIILYENGEIAK